MRLIIEWLDKDDNVLFREDKLPSMSFGDTAQISPVVPKLDGMRFDKPSISTVTLTTAIKEIMERAANQYIDEHVTSFRIQVLEDEWDKKRLPSYCECCGKFPHQYTLSDNDYKYQVCANCLSALVNTALSPAQFFSLIRAGHTTKEHLLHGDFYDDETGEALQPR